MSRAWGGDAKATPGGQGVGAQPTAGAYAVNQWRRGQPFVTLAAVFIAGTALGAWWPMARGWLGLALLPMVVMGVMLWRYWRRASGAQRAAVCWGLVALLPMAAGWSALRTAHVSEHHITGDLIETSQLAEVVGIVASEPYLRTPERGAFGRFSYLPPATLFRLSLESIVRDGEHQPAAGTVIVRIDAAEHRVQRGQRIVARGWLAPINPPTNPGEIDHRRRLAEQGVFARLTMRDRGNWSPHERAAGLDRWRGHLAARRGTLARHARNVLRAGMIDAADDDALAHQQDRLALLEALLLGQWSARTGELHDAFRRVGLSHLMAISGAHLGILMGLVWLSVRLFTPRPGRAAAVALAVLGAYLLIVPLRVPIVRAAIMAGLLCVGYGRGRGVSAMGILALAAIVVLLWRPMDLFSAGFQLSFGIVAALLLFTRPVADRMWPAAAGEPMTQTPHWWLALRTPMRRGVEFLAVSLIAFGVAMPLVAYHFEMVNPLAVLMSLLALPVVTLLLALGYLKMLLGALLPSASLLLAGPLSRVSDAMLGLVEHARHWPAATLELAQPLPVALMLAMLAVVAALLGDCFAHRRGALLGCVALLATWGALLDRTDGAGADADALRVNMFAVGHGSAYLIRVGGHTLMYDCGSQPYLDVGERRIVPALRRLGVRRIDTLFISHAHLDHYSGVLAVAEALDVGEVRAPPQLLEAARDAPHGAVAHLVERLRNEHQLRIEPTVRGWSRELGGSTRLEVLWPPAGYEALRPNDTSLMLRIQSGGRRVLMSGDVEQEAIDGLIARGDEARADVAELPHHGGWVDASPDWLEAVGPRVVLQSSGPPRSRRDPWADLLAERGVMRLATHERGMVELTMAPGEPIRWRTFGGEAGRVRTMEADAREPMEPAGAR